MSFNWVPTPQIPTPNIPEPIGSSEVSYKVDVVANTVDWGGEVRYNTANASYDVVYEFDSLNVSMMVIDNAFFDTATINTLNINVATANTVTIGTANIANLYATYGTITGNATSNLSVVTKEYVDNAIASISGGTGFDTTANLFLTQGDLLVGFSPNTAHRLAGGSNGQVLTANTSSSVGVSWEDAPTPQEALGLFMGSHWHPYKKQTTVLLKKANAIVMENGDYVPGWNNLTANIMSSGAGGMDSVSSLGANTWYSVYAIYNPHTGNKSLLLHQLESRVLEQNWPAATDTELAFLGFNYTNATNPFSRYITKVSQSFIPSVVAPVYGVELRIATQTNPSGNCWVTLEPDDGTGNASGSVLATSRIISSSERAFPGSGSSEASALFIFDTTITLTQGQRYHIVVNTDRPYFVTGTETNAVMIAGNTAPITSGASWMANVGYNADPGAFPYGYGDCRSWNAAGQRWWTTANTGTSFATPADLYFKIYIRTNRNDVVLPSGYTQKALIGYACTNTQSRLKEYKQINRTICTGYDNDWWGWRSNTTPTGDALVDLGPVVPPVKCAIQILTQQGGAATSQGTFTPVINAGTFWNNPWPSTRGIVYYQSRGFQIYPSIPVEISDTQRILAYQTDLTTQFYIASITF